MDTDQYFSELIHVHIKVILGIIQILIVSQHLGKLRTKYLDGNKKAIEVMSSAFQDGTDLIRKKIISCAIHTLNMLKPRREILLVNDSSRLCRYWTKGLLEMKLPVSGSSQFCTEMKKKM